MLSCTNEYVLCEYPTENYNLDEYRNTVQIPSFVRPDLHECLDHRSFLPSYAASSALVVQILRNEERIRIDFTHSMNEWIDFIYTLNVCL